MEHLIDLDVNQTQFCWYQTSLIKGLLFTNSSLAAHSSQFILNSVFCWKKATGSSTREYNPQRIGTPSAFYVFIMCKN